MQAHTIVGKPKQTVTLEVDGQSLTFTEGVEVAVFVVVSAQQSVQADASHDKRIKNVELAIEMQYANLEMEKSSRR